MAPVLDLVGDWAEYLATPEDTAVLEALHYERTGQVLGGEPFIETIETALARYLKPGKPGPKPRQNQN